MRRLVLVLDLVLGACGDSSAGRADAAFPVDAAPPADVDPSDPCAVAGRYDDERCDIACPAPDPDCAYLVIAHRGSPFVAVENTLAGFAAASAEGADALEIDVCRTADGVVVVFHDRDPDSAVALARQAGLEGLPWRPWVPDVGDDYRRPVDELTLAELREHYGYAFTDSGARDPTAVIPTFADVAAWAASDPHLTALFVDVKLGAGQEVLAATLTGELLDVAIGGSYQLFLMSPVESILLAMVDAASARPGHRARFILDFEDAGALAATRRLGLDAISTGKSQLRTMNDFLTELREIVAHRDEPPRLDPIVTWTFDDDADLVTVIEAGADGIMTNRPVDLARQVYRGYGDHYALTQTALACWSANAGSAAKVFCDELDLYAPLREEQVLDWICDTSFDDAMLDLFGCGLLYDSEVVFRAPGAAVWYEPTGSGEGVIVVGPMSGF